MGPRGRVRRAPASGRRAGHTVLVKLWLALLALAQAGVVKAPPRAVPALDVPVRAARPSLAPPVLKPGLSAPVVIGNTALAPAALPVFAEEAADAVPIALPAAPDLAALDSRPRAAAAEPVPTGWIGRILHSWRVDALLKERVTTEEAGFQESLVTAHDMLAQGEAQPALDLIERHFTGHRGWFAQHERYAGYYDAAAGYRRHIQERLEAAHALARSRGRSATLVAEAKRRGAWRPTALQEKGSGHCAYHALRNALSWSEPVPVPALVEWARSRLNGRVQPKLGRRVDVGEGLTTDQLVLLGRELGVPIEARGPPESPEQLRRWLAEGRKVLLALRLFNRKFGDRVLHHQVHLAAAYPSDVLGAWVYVVQDSGTGTTDLYTWRELRELTREVQLAAPSGPVSLEGRPGAAR